MTTLFKNGILIDEDWLTLGLEDDIPATGKVVIPLSRYLEQPQKFAGRNQEYAVLVAAGEDVELLKDHLNDIPVIGVEFPKFTDGRGFSAARILREQLGYSADIRAIGDYILDQMPYMRRCGVSSYEVVKPEILKELKDGEWPEVRNYLQPVGTVDEVPVGTRPWARRPATAKAAE